MEATTLNVTDADLLARHRSGEVSAYEALYARHRDALYHHARVLVRNDAVAEELVQETLFELDRSGNPGAASTGSLGPFLHRVVRRLAIDWMRSESAARGRKTEISRRWVEVASASVEPETVEELDRAISRLPKEQIEIILLHVYAGLTFQETAETIGVSSNTAMSRYRYGIQALANFMGEE